MTWLLAVANLVVFSIELRQGADLDLFLERWGMVPADLTASIQWGDAGNPAALVTLITSAFVHTGWLHLGINLLYLLVFGPRVEEALGSVRFLALYLGAAAVGSSAQVLAQPQAMVPAVGASGAVAGVIAAHLVLFPGATLGSLAPVLVFHAVADIPALLLLVLWVVAQVVSVGAASITDAGAVAWTAHVGGFVGGLVLARVLRVPRRRRW